MKTTQHPENLGWLLIFGCWLVATVASLGALFLGEIMGLPPCVLCWWQRIFMFPLVFILPVGLFPFDPKIVRYGMPLAGLGWLFAGFHLALIAGFIPVGLQPCSQGVPCTEAQVQWAGFITLPLLSFLAFSVIAGLLIFTRKATK